MAFRTRSMKLYRTKAAAAAALALCMTVCFPGCSGPTAYNPELSDLGGVYASRFSDLDLELEISGRLSEEGAQDEVIYAQENWGTNSAESMPPYTAGIRTVHSRMVRTDLHPSLKEGQTTDC